MFLAYIWSAEVCGYYARVCVDEERRVVAPGTNAGMKLTWEGKIERILEIISGFGMSVAGVKTCGDYMFSGGGVLLSLSCLWLRIYVNKRRSHCCPDNVQFLSVGIHAKILEGACVCVGVVHWLRVLRVRCGGSFSTRCAGWRICLESSSFSLRTNITPLIASSHSTSPLVCSCITTRWHI